MQNPDVKITNLKWDILALTCYKRQVIAQTFKADGCKTLINGDKCVNYSKTGCQFLATLKEIYAAKGPPGGMPAMAAWKVADRTFHQHEELILEMLRKTEKSFTKEELSGLTGFKLSTIATRISRINKKRPKLIIGNKIDKKTHYKINKDKDKADG